MREGAVAGLRCSCCVHASQLSSAAVKTYAKRPLFFPTILPRVRPRDSLAHERGDGRANPAVGRGERRGGDELWRLGKCLSHGPTLTALGVVLIALGRLWLQLV